MSNTHFSGPVSVGAGSIESITAAKTLDKQDNGKTFTLNAAVGYAITLPSVAIMGAGWKCRFIVGTAFITSDWVVTATTAIMRGGINELEVDTTEDGPSTVAGTTITFELGFETVSDYVNLECDGTYIYINGQTTLDGGISLA